MSTIGEELRHQVDQLPEDEVQVQPVLAAAHSAALVGSSYGIPIPDNS
jgi:hypothetical protein